ncbi:hypothetical protein CAEBREN_28877 [Caenorhabditis brenneri]|uniref:RING-type domain-containing protein n=1 Tax=Caenorhabditis brenneri TaxID=135651 RepID=G0MJ03_CAEBE|nr:hypothetical protein CAEBREN_28877 [Caenorhabditis brenneri]
MDDGHNELPTTSRGNDDCIDQIPSHFLVELTSLDELAFPANSTKRVKYTCVASTSKSLCLGTSTGSVYIFSRYAAKSRSRASSPVPVQVFTTRDGQISTISVSPSEEKMAIGGDSGRVSIAQLNNGQPPTLIYTTPGEARSPDRVTALSWSPDLKTVYSGHASGALQCHRITKSIFRAVHQKLMKFDGEIVQLDTLQQHVLVATTLAAHLFHVDTGTLQPVGKKVRSTHAPLGSCYVKDGDGGGSAFIVAARPNGRLWEANLVGVVYRTHQYRQSGQIPRAPPISFRSQFPTDPTQFEGLHPENQDVSLHKIHVIRVENGRLLIVSTCGSRICIVEMETSRVILVSELDFEIQDVSTCSNDVFVLLADSKGLRKFSVFERQKTVEKLNLKGFFGQNCGKWHESQPPSSPPVVTPTETVPKSDTDYTLTTESSDPATPSGIWTNPLDEEDDLKTPTSSAASSSATTSSDFNCATCGMHRSWAATSLLMAVCGGVDVLRDDFKRHGAIPQIHGNWSKVLCHVASLPHKDLTSICPRCEMSLSTVDRVCVEGWRTTCGMVEDGVRPNFERIFERCVNSSREKLEMIVSGESKDPKKSPNMEVFKPILNQKSAKIEIENHVSAPEKPENLSHQLQWLNAVPLKTMLAFAVFTIGKKAVIQIIGENDRFIAQRMKPEDWCSIVVMGAREQVLKDLLSGKTITSVLESVGASGWVSPRKKKIASPIRKNSSSGTAISSWIVDTNGICPLCKLPIKMVVGGTDRGVVSYFCGHVFHKVCIARRFTTGCIVCRVRRATRTSSSATSSPLASPVMSPRHQRTG